MHDPRNPFDLAPGEPFQPPVGRHVGGEPSAPERRLYVALLPCGCPAVSPWHATPDSEAHPRLVTLLRERNGCTVLEYPEDARPALPYCAEHAMVGL